MPTKSATVGPMAMPAMAPPESELLTGCGACVDADGVAEVVAEAVELASSDVYVDEKIDEVVDGFDRLGGLDELDELGDVLVAEEEDMVPAAESKS